MSVRFACGHTEANQLISWEGDLSSVLQRIPPDHDWHAHLQDDDTIVLCITHADYMARLYQPDNRIERADGTHVPAAAPTLVGMRLEWLE